MKKIYQNPETTVVCIEVAQMIAASEGTIAISSTTVDDASEAESRTTSFSVWGDDEEDF